MFIKNKCKNTFLEIQGKVRWDLGSPAIWTLALETGRYLRHWPLTKLTCTWVCVSVPPRNWGESEEVHGRQRSVRRSPALFLGAKTKSSVGLTMESLNAPGLAGREKGKQPLFLGRNKTVLSSLLKEANTVSSSEFSQGDLSWPYTCDYNWLCGIKWGLLNQQHWLCSKRKSGKKAEKSFWY